MLLSTSLLMLVQAADVHLVGLGAVTGSWASGSTGHVALQLAVDDLNAADTYNITWHLNTLDDGCDTIKSLGAWKDITKLADDEGWPITAYVGPACSDSCRVLAQANCAVNYNVPVISPSCTSPSLTQTSKFPDFIRYQASDSGLATALISFVTHFGWEDIAILVENRDATYLAAAQAQMDAIDSGVKVWAFTVINTADISTETARALMSVKDLGVKIIILFCFSDMVVETLVAMDDLDMNNGEYVVSVPGWIGLASAISALSAENQVKAKRSVIGLMAAVEYFPSTPAYQALKDRIVAADSTADLAYVPWAANGFDIVTGIGMVINQMAADGLPHTEFQNATRFREMFMKLNFEGVSGDCLVDENGDRKMAYAAVYSTADGSWQQYGVLDAISHELVISSPPVWGGGATNTPDGKLNKASPVVAEDKSFQFLFLVLLAMLVLGTVLLAGQFFRKKWANMAKQKEKRTIGKAETQDILRKQFYREMLSGIRTFALECFDLSTNLGAAVSMFRQYRREQRDVNLPTTIPTAVFVPFIALCGLNFFIFCYSIRVRISNVWESWQEVANGILDITGATNGKFNLRKILGSIEERTIRIEKSKIILAFCESLPMFVLYLTFYLRSPHLDKVVLMSWMLTACTIAYRLASIDRYFYLKRMASLRKSSLKEIMEFRPRASSRLDRVFFSDKSMQKARKSQMVGGTSVMPLVPKIAEESSSACIVPKS